MVFWQTLIAFDPSVDDYTFYQQECLCFILENLGLTPDMIVQNLKLKDVAERFPALARVYPVQVQSDMDVQTFVSENELLKSLSEYAKLCSCRDFESALNITSSSQLLSRT
jgi:hypothetical protein